MKRCGFVLIALLAATARAATSSAPAPQVGPEAPAALWWNNGETLSGEISAATGTSVTWKSPLFETPLELDRAVLLKVERPLASGAPAGTFRFCLRDGSQLFGDLLAITPESIGVRSERCGEVLLKRSEVLSMWRLQGEHLIFAGPNGDAGWSSTEKKFATDKYGNRIVVGGHVGTALPEAIPFLAGPGGTLDMPAWNRSAYLGVALPEKLDLEFHVRASKQRPDFSLVLAVTPKQNLMIETWDEDLVMRSGSGSEFKAIRKIKAEDRSVALRLCWDTTTRKCSVYSPNGELLVDWLVPDTAETKKKAPGSTIKVAGLTGTTQNANKIAPGTTVQLQNKGRDLSLELLRLRAWDGSPPPKCDPSQPRVELSDGSIVEGAVSQGAADSVSVRAGDEADEQNLPLDKIDAVLFSTEPAKAWQGSPSLCCADGTYLMGRVTGVGDGAAWLETAFTDRPISARLDGLRQLRFETGHVDHPDFGQPTNQLDRMEIGQKTLHGKLTAGGDSQFRWLAIGALQPALLSKSTPAEITRRFPPKTSFAGAPALFYTKAGDVLPGTLRSVDQSGVEFDSSLVETKKLAAGNLNAVQLSPPLGADIAGFQDAGWRILKGDSETVKRTAGRLTMQPATSIGHPSCLQGQDVRFTVNPNGWCSFHLRLFCNGTDGSKALRLMLVYTGNQLCSGLESSDGQMDNETVTRVAGGAVTVRLVAGPASVALEVDGMPVGTFNISPSSRRGMGLIIEPVSAWGNSPTALTLSDFSAHFEPGRTWAPEIAHDSKLQALTVPRFRHDHPPIHALVAANGDILRGAITAATANSFLFRSGLDEFRVDRDRVKAIVWLGKPVEGGPPGGGDAVEPKELDQVFQRFPSFTNVELKQWVDFLRSEAPGLQIKLPEEASGRKYTFRFNRRSIRQALDSICATARLVWKVADSHTIVLSPAPEPGNELIQRTYWLNPDAFPAPESVKSVLESKGMPFADGASVSWNPDSRQLVMKNVSAGHAKLASLLETDFGGSAGAPTHWLALTSGASLALVVDKVESDKVIGHHPVYGRCTIPLAEICSIRTVAPPPPSLAYQALENWRLVFAPDPTLPESSEPASPLLGKAPPSFKLSLLDGGSFDLDQQKGKIVVLDFWATWCGPCIKSLPALIQSMSAFPADQVSFVGVNQGEAPEQIKRFLEIRGWKLPVALDAQQGVARQFGVEGIPHTVIIGRDGKVAWTQSGYDPNNEDAAAKKITDLLSHPARN